MCHDAHYPARRWPRAVLGDVAIAIDAAAVGPAQAFISAKAYVFFEPLCGGAMSHAARGWVSVTAPPPVVRVTPPTRYHGLVAAADRTYTGISHSTFLNRFDSVRAVSVRQHRCGSTFIFPNQNHSKNSLRWMATDLSPSDWCRSLKSPKFFGMAHLRPVRRA